MLSNALAGKPGEDLENRVALCRIHIALVAFLTEHAPELLPYAQEGSPRARSPTCARVRFVLAQKQSHWPARPPIAARSIPSAGMTWVAPIRSS